MSWKIRRRYSSQLFGDLERDHQRIEGDNCVASCEANAPSDGWLFSWLAEHDVLLTDEIRRWRDVQTTYRCLKAMRPSTKEWESRTAAKRFHGIELHLHEYALLLWSGRPITFLNCPWRPQSYLRDNESLTSEFIIDWCSIFASR